jgi:hypothetical protein
MKILLFKRLSFFFTIFFLLVQNLFSQADRKVYYPHGVLWGKIEVAEIFEGKTWGIGGDVLQRRATGLGGSNPLERVLRTSIRPWFHFQFGSDARLSVSPLSYHFSQPFAALDQDLDNPNTYELRSSVQFFHHLRQKQGKLMHTWRYRLEFRNRAEIGESDFTSFFRLRLRYRFRYMFNAPDFYTPGVLYTANSVELGLNMGSPVVYNTFNQNRIYAGVGYRFLNSARVELRYVDRIRTRGSGFEFDHERGIMISVTVDQISYLGRRYTKPIKYAD